VGHFEFILNLDTIPKRHQVYCKHITTTSINQILVSEQVSMYDANLIKSYLAIKLTVHIYTKVPKHIGLTAAVLYCEMRGLGHSAQV